MVTARPRVPVVAMGCGSSSQARVVEQSVTIEQKRPKMKEHAEEEEPTATNGSQTQELENKVPLHGNSTANAESEDNVVKTEGETSNDVELEVGISQQRSHDSVTSPAETTPTVGKGISFEVPFTDNSTPSAKKPPHRLEKMVTSHQLTSDELEEKQRLAEENRQRELDKRAAGGQRLSRKERLRREIQQARASSQQDQQAEEIERKQSAGSQKREQLKEEKLERLKKREEHARKVRERAMEGPESESYMDNLEIETDVGYNVEEDDDTWNM